MFRILVLVALSVLLVGADGHKNGVRYEDQAGCWFGAHTLPLVDTNDDGEGDTKRLVGVKAVPSITLLHGHSMTVTPGEPLTIRMRLTSARSCGSIDVTGLSLAIEPLSGPHWDTMHVTATLRIDGNDRGPATAEHHRTRRSYRWDLVRQGPLAVLERSETSLEFTLNTKGIPEGATFRVMVDELNWSDHATSAQIVGDTAPQSEAYVDITVRSNGS